MGYSIMGTFNRHRTATRHVDWKGVICSNVQIGTSVGAYRLPSVWMVVSFRTRQMGRSWKLYSGCNLQQILQMTTGRPPVNMDHQRILGLNTCREGGVLNPWRTKLQGSMFSPSSSARTGLGPCRFGVIVSHTATLFFFYFGWFMWIHVGCSRREKDHLFRTTFAFGSFFVHYFHWTKIKMVGRLPSCSRRMEVIVIKPPVFFWGGRPVHPSWDSSSFKSVDSGQCPWFSTSWTCQLDTTWYNRPRIEMASHGESWAVHWIHLGSMADFSRWERFQIALDGEPTRVLHPVLTEAGCCRSSGILPSQSSIKFTRFGRYSWCSAVSIEALLKTVLHPLYIYIYIYIYVDDHDGDVDDDDDDDDYDDDASPVVIAGPGKTQAFAVYIYIYIIHIHTLYCILYIYIYIYCNVLYCIILYYIISYHIISYYIIV